MSRETRSLGVAILSYQTAQAMQQGGTIVSCEAGRDEALWEVAIIPTR